MGLNENLYPKVYMRKVGSNYFDAFFTTKAIFDIKLAWRLASNYLNGISMHHIHIPSSS